MTNDQHDQHGQPMRRFRTALGVVSTRECPMRELRGEDQFVGPDGATVYRVVTPTSQHKRGWLIVRNLTMTDAEARAQRAEAGAEAGDPRDGFFTYPPDTRMHRIV